LRAALDSPSSAWTLEIAALRLRWAIDRSSSKVSDSESNCTKPLRSFSMSRFVFTIFPDRSTRANTLPIMFLPFLDNEGASPGSRGPCISSSDCDCSELVWCNLETEEWSTRRGTITDPSGPIDQACFGQSRYPVVFP
jgi:hypothetical protein